MLPGPGVVMLLLLSALLACAPNDGAPAASGGKPGGAETTAAKPVAPTPALAPFSGQHARGAYASLGDASLLLDGDVSTTWSVAGDALGDRVEVRLEAPVAVDEIELVGCPPGGGPATAWTVVANGAVVRSTRVNPGETLRVGLGAQLPVGSFGAFVSAEQGTGGACLAELSLRAGGVALPLRPPRSVSGLVRATSVARPPELFHPFHLVDGRLEMVWASGRAGTGGVGDRVELVLDHPAPLVALEVWNGDPGVPAEEAGPRLTRLDVAYDGSAPVVVDVPVAEGPVRVPLAPRAPVRALGLTVRSVQGDTRQGLRLPELRLWDAFGPFTVSTPARADRAALVQTQLAGTKFAERLDERLVPVCGGTGELRLRGNLDLHLVAPAAVFGRPGEGVVVLDGVWAPVGTRGKTRELAVGGRLHDRSAPVAPATGTEDGERWSEPLQLVAFAELNAEEQERWFEELGRDLPPGLACLAASAKDRPDAAALARRHAWLFTGKTVAFAFWRPE